MSDAISGSGRGSRQDIWFARIRETNTVDALESLRAEIEGDPEAENALEYIKDKIGRLTAEAGREALQNGTYYSRIDQVFVKDTVPAIGGKGELEETEMYQSCCRSLGEAATLLAQKQKLPKKQKRQKQEQPSQEQGNRNLYQFRCRGQAETDKKNPYTRTLEAAHSDQNVPADDANSSARTSTQKKGVVWKKNAVANDLCGDIAHLVPASVKHANTYWFVTDFLFGIDQDRTWKHILKLIHGSKESDSESKAARAKHTGIKHMVTNKILLAGQRDYFDFKPCIVFVPILTKEQALNWTGGSYHAIAMIDGFPPFYSSPEEHNGDADTTNSALSESVDGVSVKEVAFITFFIFRANANETASVPELRLATDLLRDYTRAILHARRDREPQDAEVEEKIDDVLGAFFPKLCDNPQNAKVRKIQFESNEDSGGHPAPDPLLLVTMAVDVIQRRHGFRIVAAAEEEDDRSELSIQAEEEYLQWREARTSATNPIGLDIAIH